MVKPATPIGPADYRIVYKDSRYIPQKRGFLGMYWTIPEACGNGWVIHNHQFEWQALEVIEKHRLSKIKSAELVREFYDTKHGIQDARTGDIIDPGKEREKMRPPPPKK